MMRTKGVLIASFLLASVLHAAAQLNGTTPPASGVPAMNADGQELAAPQAISSQPVSPDQLNGSGIVDKLVPGVIKLSLLDAIDRGIKHNLALLLSREQTSAARAQRLRELSGLLPHVSFTSSENLEQINLAAFGIPVTVNGSTIVGPFGVFDARPTMSDRLLDFSAINRLRSAAENQKAANFTVQDARELVVLSVGNQYLLVLEDAARLETSRAQLTTAQAIFRQAQDMKRAGVVAGIDVLRAQVQMQQQQQRVLSVENQLAKQSMRLGRAIGFPPAQQFELTDKVPYAPAPELNLEEELARTYTRRPEYLAAESRVHAAEFQVASARDERLPTIDVNGDYGVIGPSPGSARQTYTVAAGVRIPIFHGNRVKADVLEAQSILNQLKSQLADLHARIEFEVRSAMLDVKTADEQVAVARQSIDLAAEQLKEAQDRFRSGVSTSLEVVQAQEAVAVSNETYIQALYLNSIAKLSLVRALGVAEQQTRAFLATGQSKQ